MGSILSLAEVCLDVLSADRDLVDAYVTSALPPHARGLLHYATTLATASRGATGAVERGAWMNAAALGLQMTRLRGRIVAHTLRPSAVERVASTDVHALPARPPRLLAGPWIAEVHDPARDALWQTAGGQRVLAVGGYMLEDIVCVTVIDTARAYVGRWRADWGSEQRFDTVAVDDAASPLLAGIDAAAHGETVGHAVRLSIVLGLLLEAEGTPLRTHDEERKPPRQQRKRGLVPKGAGEWRRTYVTLDPRESVGRTGRAADEATVGAGAADREAVRSVVTGHLKTQACGPGGKERKLIYVAGYEARRWVSPGPVRLVVS